MVQGIVFKRTDISVILEYAWFLTALVANIHYSLIILLVAKPQPLKLIVSGSSCYKLAVQQTASQTRSLHRCLSVGYNFVGDSMLGCSLL